ncbi:hypothetical protein BDP55DRAFT_15906 [Colletotrichum godetiae]|uniref:Uncharacterized protein n=1 Tax=Colletotrichum godetiae TaxID=1209918 RepID=A0AAJ0B273_9PEZI|nr:uncharacterized protein BDP55DRAFT_15906 [Colletotrichum godetiae]KAK1701286.1 hypothetical protein BDP55DRAFT_15906 [Colletotrichum godetiae]
MNSALSFPRLVEQALWVAAAWALGIEGDRRADAFRWFSVVCFGKFFFLLSLLVCRETNPASSCTCKPLPARIGSASTNLGVCAVYALCASLRRPLAFAPCHLPARRRRCRTIDNCWRNHTPSPCHPLIDQQGSRMLQGDLCPELELTKTLPSGLEMRGVTTPDRLLARLLGGLGRYIWSAPTRTC